MPAMDDQQSPARAPLTGWRFWLAAAVLFAALVVLPFVTMGWWQ